VRVFFICSLLVFPCFLPTKIGTQPLLIIGHRGACGYEPENTLRSFKRALEHGVKMIELDVYVCASGEVVVMHDDTIDRTTNGRGAVVNLTLEQLCAFDAGKGERIPLLSEVFDMVNRTVIINVELKGPGTAQPVAQLINDYVNHKGWAYTDFVVSSFNHFEILAFQVLCPAVRTGAILAGTPVRLAEFAYHAQADYAVLNYEAVIPALVEDAHKRNIQVLAYTVNTREAAAHLHAMGVDGIFTNYPDIFNVVK
jgi:glycerophosphoryl diester phosphodiesterase